MITNLSSNQERFLGFYYFTHLEKTKLFLLWVQMSQHIILTITLTKLCIKFGRISSESILINLCYQLYTIPTLFLMTTAQSWVLLAKLVGILGPFLSCPPIYFILH